MDAHFRRLERDQRADHKIAEEPEDDSHPEQRGNKPSPSSSSKDGFHYRNISSNASESRYLF